jgi:hypothetical protein
MKQEEVWNNEMSGVVKGGSGRDIRGGGEVEVLRGRPERKGYRETRVEGNRYVTLKELTDRPLREGRGPDFGDRNPSQ